MTNTAQYVSEAQQAYEKLSDIEKAIFDGIITQQYSLLMNISRLQNRTDSSAEQLRRTEVI